MLFNQAHFEEWLEEEGEVLEEQTAQDLYVLITSFGNEMEAKEGQLENSYREMCEECGYTLGQDSIADREGYNDYIDALNRDGELSDNFVQYMDNPF